jgi:hypothetical protein|eukprot:8493-Pelagococcus_subviridis.AAC.2
MTRADAALAGVNVDVGRAVIASIPRESVRAAKALIDEAIGIVGRYAVARRALRSSRPVPRCFSPSAPAPLPRGSSASSRRRRRRSHSRA